MHFQLLLGQIRFIVGLILFVNVLMIAGTGLAHYYYFEIISGNWEEASKTKYILMQFTLGTENTLATWYSSMLFLLVGTMSFFCYHVQKKLSLKEKHHFLNYGWVIFSIIFILLSFDEMASMHERLGSLHSLNPFGNDPPGWVFLLGLPIAAVAILMITFCWIHIKRVPVSAGFAFAAVLLFVSIPFQEYIEVFHWQAAPDPDTWERPRLLLILEESAEIFGATFMLISALIYAGQAIEQPNQPTLSPVIDSGFRLNIKATIPIIVTVICSLALPMVIIDQSSLLAAEGDIGVVRNWFPAAAAFLVSLLSFYIFFKRQGEPYYNRYNYLFFGIFSLLISAYFGSNLYVYFWYPENARLKLIFVGFIALITAVLAMRQLKTGENIYERTGVILWSILSVAAVSMHNMMASFTAYFAFSALFISLLIRVIKRDLIILKSQKKST